MRLVQNVCSIRKRMEIAARQKKVHNDILIKVIIRKKNKKL